jgi:hypothetical protein
MMPIALLPNVLHDAGKIREFWIVRVVKEQKTAISNDPEVLIDPAVRIRVVGV